MTTAWVATGIERALLGCLLESPLLIGKVATAAPEDLFFLASHRRIFSHIKSLQEKSIGIDLPSLRHSLSSHGELDQIGGAEYITGLVDECVTGNFASYLKTLRELASRRSLALELERTSAIAADGSTSTESLIVQLEKLSAAYRNSVLAERNPRFRSARELASEIYPQVRWIAGRFVAAGSITLAVGKVKAAGKTTFFTHLVSAVTRGEPFLGLGTSRGPVVYLTEQSDVTFRAALGRAGLLTTENLRVLTWSDVSGRPWPEVAMMSMSECKRIGAGLLVVDTIGQFTGLVGDAENNAGDALRAMQPLQQIAAQGIAVLVSQHERKGGGDIEDSGRGSSAFAGAADIVLNIRRRPGNGNPNLRVLRALSRFDETPNEMTIELTTGGYRCRDSETIASDDAENAIMRVVAPCLDKANTIDELLQAAGIKRTAGQDAITKLRKEGRIDRVGVGAKGDPFRYFAPENPSAGNITLGRQKGNTEQSPVSVAQGEWHD